MKYLVLFFSMILVYKLANNMSLLVRTNYYSKKYDMYIRDIKNGFTQYVPMTTKLFKAADLQECTFTVVEPVGYGKIQTATVSHFINLANRREDVVGATIRCFDQSKAIFKARLIEAFSPLYWIRAVLFFPKQLFTYLGVSADSVFVKVTQVIYWVATPLLIAFRDSIYQYIISLFG